MKRSAEIKNLKINIIPVSLPDLSGNDKHFSVGKKPSISDNSISNTAPGSPKLANLFDRAGSDIKINMDYNAKFALNVITPVRFSYLLIDLGNRLLQLESTARMYTKLKNPIQVKITNLEDRLSLYEVAGICFENKEAMSVKEINEWITKQDKLKETYPKILKDLKAELTESKIIYDLFKKLQPELKSAFPLVPKKIPETLIKKYNEQNNNNSKEVILQDLLTVSKILKTYTDGSFATLKADQLVSVNRIYKLFDTEQAKFETSTTAKNQRTKILNSIKSVIGRSPSDTEIKEYAIKHGINPDLERDEIIKVAISYIENNSKDIYRIMESSAILAVDSDYLKLLEEQDFLVQVRIYRKINITVGEFLCKVQGQSHMVVPPGKNGYITMNDNGTVTTKSLAFQKYSDLAKQTWLLENYKSNYFGDKTHEYSPKDEIFHSTFQIEAIRSTSTLVTVPMFFDLALEKYQPLRLFATKQYGKLNPKNRYSVQTHLRSRGE